MPGISTAIRSALVSHAWGRVIYTPPTTIYVALFTTAPNFDTGTGGTEVSGGSYALLAVTNNTTNFPDDGTTIDNGVDFTFVTPTANWGTVVAFGYYDSATRTTWMGGNNLTASRVIESGNIVKFPAGSLTIALNNA